MLTVKHIDPRNVERVFAAIEIQYHSASDHPMPASAPERGYGLSTGSVRFILPVPHTIGGDRIEYVYEGSVYVMNETGKTVAKYDLGGWMEAAENTPSKTVTMLGGAIIA